MAIIFHEKEVSAGLKSKNLLKKWLNDVIGLENARTGKINIVFTTDSQLLELNKKYLSRDYLTDILAFEYSDSQTVDGDLFISVERVKENSDNFHVSFKNELKRVIVHGILHLLGYRDSTEKEKSLMTQMEDHYLLISPAI